MSFQISVLLLYRKPLTSKLSFDPLWMDGWMDGSMDGWTDGHPTNCNKVFFKILLGPAATLYSTGILFCLCPYVWDVSQYLKKLQFNKTANIKSFVTYVTQLPTGEESGKYLALDLGGTNFRVIVVEITSGCRSIRMQSTKHAVRIE